MFFNDTAFLPNADVISGFNIVKEYAITNCEPFLSFLTYVDNTYIMGKYNEDKKKRSKPLYAIAEWNLHERVKMGLPRTNNKTERYNQQMQIDAGDHHLAFCQMIETLRLEQGNTESLIVKISMGVVNKQKNFLK